MREIIGVDPFTSAITSVVPWISIFYGSIVYIILMYTGWGGNQFFCVHWFLLNGAAAEIVGGLATLAANYENERIDDYEVEWWEYYKQYSHYNITNQDELKNATKETLNDIFQTVAWAKDAQDLLMDCGDICDVCGCVFSLLCLWQCLVFDRRLRVPAKTRRISVVTTSGVWIGVAVFYVLNHVIIEV